MNQKVKQEAENRRELLECEDGVCVLKGSESAGADRALITDAENTMIPFRAEWKHWSGQSSPPSGWSAIDFDDGEWPTGPAPLGYLFREQGTHLLPHRALLRQPAYFRHEFWLKEQPVQNDVVRLAIHRTGGVIVNLNGSECFRDNAPEVPAPPSTIRWALSQTEDCPLQVPVWPHRLRQGKNVLAVEVRACGSGLCFDLSLVKSDRPVLRQPIFPRVPTSLLGDGQPAPNLKWLVAGSREKHSLMNFRGRKVILDIMSVYCGPCWQALPKLQHWTRKLRDRGVVVAIVCAGGTIADLEDVLQRHPNMFPDVLIGAEPSAGDFYATTAYRELGIPAFPSMLLVDESGMIRASCVGHSGPEYDEFLRQLAAMGVEVPEFHPAKELEYSVDGNLEVHLK